MVICDVKTEPVRKPVWVSPRGILRKHIARLTETGTTAMGASEDEHYNFKETYNSATEKHFENLTPFGWCIEDHHLLQGNKEEVPHSGIREHFEHLGMPVESIKGE